MAVVMVVVGVGRLVRAGAASVVGQKPGAACSSRTVQGKPPGRPWPHRAN